MKKGDSMTFRICTHEEKKESGKTTGKEKNISYDHLSRGK